MYKCYAFIKFIPKYYILYDDVMKLFPYFIFLACLLLQYRIQLIIFILILFPETSPNSYCNRFLMSFLGCSVYIVTCKLHIVKVVYLLPFQSRCLSFLLPNCPG